MLFAMWQTLSRMIHTGAIRGSIFYETKASSQWETSRWLLVTTGSPIYSFCSFFTTAAFASLQEILSSFTLSISLFNRACYCCSYCCSITVERRGLQHCIETPCRYYVDTIERCFLVPPSIVTICTIVMMLHHRLTPRNTAAVIEHPFYEEHQ